MKRLIFDREQFLELTRLVRWMAESSTHLNEKYMSMITELNNEIVNVYGNMHTSSVDFDKYFEIDVDYELYPKLHTLLEEALFLEILSRASVNKGD